ncbi:metallophosphoesterase [Macrococcus equipercicus]|uniref:Metallophosphoesterase n=1 Tax=Macrococcus equipercicus TaxID=69967 RepID=A0A9Q9F3Q9_9STAP|nr:metallophosphoesterase [Macrococcus equipercicus]KAA1042653.1 metallophosphoesterase [Macrococcus equipercicus]UTH14519.1 metallophosphoesterase [Macrococcus equipercicus]
MIELAIRTLLKLKPRFLYARADDVKVKTYRIPLLHNQHARPFRIVHISDLHIGFNYTYEDLIEHINKVNTLRPDIVMITGDLFDRIDRYKGKPQAFSPLLRTIQAPSGVYFSYGNHDQRSSRTHKIQQVIEDSGIHLMNNFGRTIDYDGEAIYISGIDDVLNSKGNVTQALKNRTDSHDFTIMMVHEPDFADYVKRFDVDLQLSGHTHGGQIRLPLLGAPILPALGKKYVRGLYQLMHHHHSMMLHVSPGLGTTHLPIRFFCPPEITVLELTTKEAE